MVAKIAVVSARFALMDITPALRPVDQIVIVPTDEFVEKIVSLVLMNNDEDDELMPDAANVNADEFQVALRQIFG